MKNIEIAKNLIKLFNDNGKELYLVGGSVRDYLLFNDFDDFDFATSSTPTEVIELLNITKYDKYAINFGTVKTTYNGVNIEITSFRKESEYDNNRKPSSVIFIKDMKIDSIRRDFTINAMYMDNEKIYDFYDGQLDLSKRVIDTVNDADASFKQDALRIIRAIRFASILNFKLSRDVKLSIKHNKELIKNLSHEKLDSEIKKVSEKSALLRFNKLLKHFKLYNYLYPKN